VPSRDNNTRTAVAAATSESGTRPTGAAPAENAGSGQATRGPKTSRLALKNWRVRSRLILLITIPTLTAVVLGGTYIYSSVQNALAYQRVEQLANLSYSVTGLAAHLEDERDQTLEYIGLGTAGRAGIQSGNSTEMANAQPNLDVVRQLQGETTPWVRDVKQNISAIGADYSAQIRGDASQISTLLNSLPSLRAAATGTLLPVNVVLQDYTSMVNVLLTIDDNIALGSGDPTLTGDVRALNLVSLIAEEASEQRGLLAYAFAQAQRINPQVLGGVTTALADEQANVAEFDRVATPQQVTLYKTTVAGGLVDYASGYELQAIQYGQEGRSLVLSTATANAWYGAMTTGTIGGMRSVEQDLVAATIARASALRRHAIITATLVGAAVLLVLLLALLLTTVVGRSMVRPLRRLRSGALEVAGVRLPETVRRMSDSDGATVPLDVEPIDVDSSDEIGEVARAFDQVHREALRLAANEAALRGNVNAMFVNLSRRSQSLVERQIRLIDDLEQGEQEPDRLSSLFQMDHLATRMRRNSENLLVLAGHDASRRWNQPVALVDVLRAAVSEIEQYERVTLNVQPGIAVRGHAVNDVVHLLAELAENATSFSSAETPVVVAGHLLTSGGVLLDITDQGVGMGAEEMAHANWRLDNPPVVDVAVSRRMGLFVVARLAARHGIRVRLRPAAGGGLTALVWLPDEVVSLDSEAGAPGMRRFDPAVGADVPPGTPVLTLPAGSNGVDLLGSPAEQEINAARAPKFASLQAESGSDGGLIPRRVPGAGLHPGNAGWGGAATTSPLPAVEPDSTAESAKADDDFAAAAGAWGETVAAAWPDAERLGTGPRPVVDLAGQPTVDFDQAPQSAALAQPVTLGQPSVVGQQSSLAGGPGSDTARADSPTGSFNWDTGAGSSGGSGSSAGTAVYSAGSADVVVPPAEHVATENRLPIFEAVESDWFRRGRSGLGGWAAQQDAGADGVAPAEPDVSWATPSDQGWEAAAAASSPTTGGTTTAGLPKRVPQANLVPGAAAPESAAPAPARSAAATRERFASFQRGIREGRAAVSDDEGNSDEDDGSR
jgi:signal transduction histidine kinase